jgi:hypothetical protein
VQTGVGVVVNQHAIQIDTPRFCAGVVIDNGVVVRVPPVLRYMIGWSEIRVCQYAELRGWRCHEETTHIPGVARPVPERAKRL